MIGESIGDELEPTAPLEQELTAIRDIAEAIKDLPPDSKRRVLRYATDRVSNGLVSRIRLMSDS